MDFLGFLQKKDPGTSPSYRTVCPCGTRIVPGSCTEISLFEHKEQENFFNIL